MRAAIAVTCAAALIAGGGLSACSHGANRTESAPNRTSWRPPTCGSSVAQAVARDDAQTIHSIIHTGSADPHSYRGHPRRRRGDLRPSLVVYSGGGYDAWVDGVLAHSDIPTVDAYSLLDAAALGEPQPASEHVFYDLGTARGGRRADRRQARRCGPHPFRRVSFPDRNSAQGRCHRSTPERSIGTAHPGAAVVCHRTGRPLSAPGRETDDKTPKGVALAAIEAGHRPSTGRCRGDAGSDHRASGGCPHLQRPDGDRGRQADPG